MDIVPPEVRSRMMGAVPQAHTKPEITVRKLIHRLGFRFRLHRKDLPGRPDIVLPRLNKVVLVHGCYWHRHGCEKTTTPSSNVGYWETKFRENVQRDQKVLRDLQHLGWDVIIVWECETYDVNALVNRLNRFLCGDVS